MMKKIFIIASLMSLGISGCQKLDLNPLSEGSTENWYKDEQEIELSLNALYNPTLWYVEAARLYNTDRYTDDWGQRAQLYDYVAGTITSDWSDAENTWTNTYKGIARANSILDNLSKAKGSVSEQKLNEFKGEACFFRASFYSYLIFLFGDVPFYTHYLPLTEAFKKGRTDKEEILKSIYEDYDTAAAYLPVKNDGGGFQRVTKGTAYAFKARTALWMGDYKTVKSASEKCMELNVYSLDPSYSHLFLPSTTSDPEFILVFPRSEELTGSAVSVKSYLPRNAGGTAVAQPSWELFCSYTCTDGLPIDKSPLYDPQHPFKNRDPRLAETTVEFGTPFLGYMYDPGAAKVENIKTGKLVKNKDSQLGDQYAPFDGLMLKKGVDDSWADDMKADLNIIVMRYADVLLMYAEAKMELGEIDDSLFSALNQVRARAYGVSPDDVNQYPVITETDQAKLRMIIRNERRVEFAWEGRRFFDLIRWKIADIALSRPIVALPTKSGLAANIASGDYFFPKNALPIVEENGLVDLSPLINTGKVRVVIQRGFQDKEYLWPIPTQEIKIDKSLTQNPDY